MVSTGFKYFIRKRETQNSMNTFFYAMLGFALAIGLLTTVHEFGHFWVARRLGIKVLRFSIGFGKPVISWYDKYGTQYAIGYIPLGGYVKMLDENESKVPQHELKLAFNNKPVWARMLVIAAGPVFNLLFAVIAYWLVFMWGVSSIIPILGNVPHNSVAYAAGLRAGQEIVAVDAQATPTWEDIAVQIASADTSKAQLNITVLDRQQQKQSTHELTTGNLLLTGNAEGFLQKLGIQPADPIAAVVDKLTLEMPAQRAGIQPGDLIISFDGTTVHSRTHLVELLQANSAQTVDLGIKRDDQAINVTVTPEDKKIGIQFANQPIPSDLIRLRQLTPIPAFIAAWQHTAEYTILTTKFLAKMIVGKVSWENIGGPISIAKIAGRTVRSGVEYFLGFLAVISISLGVLNMLPIPVLDGGHFMYCIIELIRGKKLSTKALAVGQTFGFVVLSGIMLLALYNDLLRILR